MKVLHLLVSNKFSGAENVVCQIIDNFKQYEMAYCSPSGSIEDELERRGIQYIPLKNKSIKSVKKVIKEYKPDIIHAHDFTASVLASKSGFRGKIISHLHSNPPFIKRWGIKSLIYSCTINRYDKVILVSKAVYDEAVFRKKLNNKHSIIYNCVDPSRVLEMANEPNDIKSDIVFVGRLAEPKNPIRFIEIIKLIKLKYPKIKAIMLGDGELKELCIEKIKQEKLEENIDMMGFLENPYKIIKGSKIMIISSRWEGFPLVAIESLILSKPVFATPVGGLKEIFEKNIEFLFSTNEDAVKKSISILEDDLSYKKEKESLHRILERYADKTKWQDALEKIYM